MSLIPAPAFLLFCLQAYVSLVGMLLPQCLFSYVFGIVQKIIFAIHIKMSSVNSL